MDLVYDKMEVWSVYIYFFYKGMNCCFDEASVRYSQIYLLAIQSRLLLFP